MMPRLCLLLILLGACACVQAAGGTPPPTVELPLAELELGGEVATPGRVNLEGLPLRSVIVREAVLENGAPRFVGAYRYDGYALADILSGVALAKKNAAEFPPPVDLLVRVENAAGETVVLSWGEIIYTAKPYRILVARRVTPIVPAKTGKVGLLHLSRSLSAPTTVTVSGLWPDPPESPCSPVRSHSRSTGRRRPAPRSSSFWARKRRAK